MTDTAFRRVLILNLLYDHDREHPNSGEIPSVVELLGDRFDPDLENLWRGTLRELDSRGLIKLAETMGFQGTSAMITDSGREEVEVRRARRSDPASRNNSARDAVVQFLYEQPGHKAQNILPLLNSGYAYFEGEMLSMEDLEAAQQYLGRKQMIKVTPVAGNWVPPQVELTDRGIDCAEQFGGMAAAYLRHYEGGAGNTTVNIHGNVTGSNVAWNSRQITQSATTSTGLAGDEVAALIAAINQALPVLGLNEGDLARVRSQLEAAQSELESAEPDAGVVRSLLKRVLSKIGEVAETSLGLLLSAYAKYLMTKAGVPLDE